MGLWTAIPQDHDITPKGHCHIHRKRAQLALTDRFTASLISSSLPRCPDVRGMTSLTETHLTAEPRGHVPASSNDT